MGGWETRLAGRVCDLIIWTTIGGVVIGTSLEEAALHPGAGEAGLLRVAKAGGRTRPVLAAQTRNI